MIEKVNIVCVYWKGEFRTRDFNPNDVWRLHASISKHMDRPFDFFVFTNDVNAQLPGYTVRLLHSDEWVGWWAKMEIFRAGISPSNRRTLYMDLDNHVIRSLAPLFEHKGAMVMFPGGTKNTPTKYQNSTMLFDIDVFRWMYTKFMTDAEYWMSHFRGDQDLLSDWLPTAPTFPSKWMVKLSVIEKRFRKSTPPDDAIIVTGQPRSGCFRKTHTIPWLEKMARG